VRIAEDLTIERQDDENTYVSLGPIAQWVRDREIALETSPSSNLQTGAIAAWGDELVDHPFDLLYQLGFRVTVNTDNRLMSGTSMTDEMVRLVDAFDYSLADLRWFTINAMKSAFLPFAERLAIIDTVIKPRYADLMGLR
jgi:adenosine deaminase